MKVIFRVMDIPWTANRVSWKFVMPKIVICMIVALVALPAHPLLERLMWGLIYGIAFLTVMIVHTMGHIIASKRMLPPMTEARITPILIETRYDKDPPALPDRIHLIRSLGGPLMNLLVGLLLLPVWLLTRHHLASFLMWANFIFGLAILLPFRGIDGGVIWPILTRRRGQPYGRI